ncbi:MAG: hypothetical protein PVH68_14695 [Armatimonadota bacterium]
MRRPGQAPQRREPIPVGLTREEALRRAREAGREAAREGVSARCCPWDPSRPENRAFCLAWLRGWRAERHERQVLEGEKDEAWELVAEWDERYGHQD